MNDDLPTILFIPTEWVEHAVWVCARTGEPVCLHFYPTKINRRSYERRQFERAIECGVERRASLRQLQESVNGQVRAA